MRVAILGVGGLGRTLASELRGDSRVTSLLLVDLYGERARVLTGIRGRVAIEAKQLNVENRIALTKAIAGVDLVINATLPKYNLATMHGYASFPLYSREVFLSDILTPPTVWLDGALQDRAPLSEPEEYGFPPPVGSQRTYLMSHEEVKTLPKFLHKPIGRVDFKYVLDPHLVQAILSLAKLDLLADSHMIWVGNQMVSPGAGPGSEARIQSMGGAQLADAVVGTRARRLTYGPIRLPRADRFTRLRPTCAAGKSFITGVTIRVVGGWVVKRVVLAFLTVGLLLGGTVLKLVRTQGSHVSIDMFG